MCLLGVPPARCGDDRIYAAHRSSSVHVEAQALYLHLREPASSKITVWHEGQTPR